MINVLSEIKWVYLLLNCTLNHRYCVAWKVYHDLVTGRQKLDVLKQYCKGKIFVVYKISKIHFGNYEINIKLILYFVLYILR